MSGVGYNGVGHLTMLVPYAIEQDKQLANLDLPPYFYVTCVPRLEKPILMSPNTGRWIEGANEIRRALKEDDTWVKELHELPNKLPTHFISINTSDANGCAAIFRELKMTQYGCFELVSDNEFTMTDGGTYDVSGIDSIRNKMHAISDEIESILANISAYGRSQ